MEMYAKPVSATQGLTYVGRQSADYHSSIWGDYFLTNTYDEMTIIKWREEAEKLKENVRKMLTSDISATTLTEKMNLIDAIQRLGVAYHFEQEIEEELEQIFKANCKCNDDDDKLYNTTLQFRLLRQHGFNISCDIFNQFKDDKGNFNEKLTEDIIGMLSLYEATHLRVHNEDILDEAHDFTGVNLKSIAAHLNHSLAVQIHQALKRPIHKEMPRLEARRYFSFYQQDESHNKNLLKFAKLDFNILQKLHREELTIITRWWKDLDFTKKLPFARDRITECYFWILGVYFEPQYSTGRKFLTKVIAMISTIDDIYDVYGTKDELELFTNAVQRWEISLIDDLPEYMRIVYQALLDMYGEMEEEMLKEGRSYQLYYAKEALKAQVQAYFEESKWLGNDYMPTMEEYMKVASASSGYPTLGITSLVGMGEIISKDDFEWLQSGPIIVHAISVLARLKDDVASYKNERNRKHIPSAVQCYINQYGVSEEEACQVLNNQVEEAWKDINEACLKPLAASMAAAATPPMEVLTRLLNLCRMADVFYEDGDAYTHASGKMKDYVASLLINLAEI